MNAVDAADLLAFMATFDGREVQKGDPETWAAVLGNMSLDTARAAVATHYSASRSRIMPADLWNLIRSNEPRHLGEKQAACPFRDCTCTHTAPCDRGWIDNDDGTSVRPCPTCRPEQARIVNEAPRQPGPERLAALRERSLRRRAS